MCDNDDLIEACKSGYHDKVLNLLRRNFTVHVRDSKQATPLYYSCCQGYYDISCALIQYGSDVNARVQWGSTPLHAASDRGHIECVQLLIYSGADVTIQNNRGDTALHLCAYRGYIEIVKLLIQYKSDLFTRNSNEKTPADEAEGNNHHNTAELLRQNMIALQRNISQFGQRTTRQIIDVPNQYRKTLPPSVHSPASMSIPPSAAQNNDNFVRYSSDLTKFTSQVVLGTHTAIPTRKIIDQNPPNYRSGEQNGHTQLENSRVNLQNGVRNGHSSPEFNQNGVVKMLDLNRSPLHVQGREAMETFAETLQLQLVKKNEECDLKDKKIKQLKDELQEKNEKLKAIQIECVRHKEENEKLKHSQKTDFTSTNYERTIGSGTLGLDHQGILEALALLKQRCQSIGGDDHSIKTLLEVLKSRQQTQAPPTSLDTPSKEWKVGTDFLLLGDKPLNCSSDGDRDGSCSLVFLINHKKEQYVLKMMTNLINLQSNHHGDGHSLDQFLIHNFGSEHNIPVNLPYHPNIVTIRHHYMGATDRFKKFLNVLIPSKIDVPIEMANRTSFLVMDKYPQTLKSFMVRQRSEFPEPNFGLDTRFVLHLLYQILSAVHHLQKNGVAHRDIKADNIFLDSCLRPVLTDFGFATKVIFCDGKPVKFTDGRQIYAGNNHAWAPELTRFNRLGIISDGNDEMTTLQQVYSRADVYAVSRMFYSILRPMGEQDAFPQSSISRPHYEESDIPELPGCYSAGLRYILHNLVLDNPIQRMTNRRAMLCVGMMMFNPKQGDVKIESDVVSYYQARILTLLSNEDKLSWKGEGQSLTMKQSVEMLSPLLESDFLSNTSPSEFWEIYQDLKMKKLLT